MVVEFVRADVESLGCDLHERVSCHCDGHALYELLYLITPLFVLVIVRKVERLEYKHFLLSPVLEVRLAPSTSCIEVSAMLH